MFAAFPFQEAGSSVKFQWNNAPIQHPGHRYSTIDSWQQCVARRVRATKLPAWFACPHAAPKRKTERTAASIPPRPQHFVNMLIVPIPRRDRNRLTSCPAKFCAPLQYEQPAALGTAKLLFFFLLKFVTTDTREDKDRLTQHVAPPTE
jgi:hypothetical protein